MATDGSQTAAQSAPMDVDDDSEPESEIEAVACPECPVCYVTLKDCAVLPMCGHVLCPTCDGYAWDAYECPVCRASYDDGSLEVRGKSLTACADCKHLSADMHRREDGHVVCRECAPKGSVRMFFGR